RSAPGFAAIYKEFVAGGWNSLPFDPEFGGQGMPWLLATTVQEMWQAANMGFGLVLLLNQGAIDAIHHHGSAEQKAAYLPKMISGEWTGTMNLTEPQAGSDLGQLKSRAVKEGDHYRITGQKIFITYGDHDFTENIVHMVLARTPDAPAGSKGISLFLVPKVMVGPDGTLKGRNDLRCVSLEHKLGINASPTAVMAYGDNGGAIGYLIGAENRGLECMFTMMNNARLTVGLQGVAIAERAYQQARDYARARVQSRELGSSRPEPVPIIRHPDIRRMLLTMRALTEATRALTYSAGLSLDLARRHPEAAERARHQRRVDLLTPVVKAWASETGVEVASLGVQVHGGMGYIEETGAAQHYRDARITPIYEGTSGIQANDLVFRKLGRDRGAAAAEFFAEIAALDGDLATALGGTLDRLREQLAAGLAALRGTTEWLVDIQDKIPQAAAASATPYLQLFGRVAGGYLMAKAALAAHWAQITGEGDSGFYDLKIITAQFYGDHVLSQAPALRQPIEHGWESVLDLDEQQI
ncbi:MAG: acyl-CoA dehydrogenase, partial [Proteobacteria bacterium]|nr:acyl-CoA dehydrogenase [Pseudomonadota bacterium]